MTISVALLFIMIDKLLANYQLDLLIYGPANCQVLFLLQTLCPKSGVSGISPGMSGWLSVFILSLVTLSLSSYFILLFLFSLISYLSHFYFLFMFYLSLLISCNRHFLILLKLLFSLLSSFSSSLYPSLYSLIHFSLSLALSLPFSVSLSRSLSLSLLPTYLLLSPISLFFFSLSVSLDPPLTLSRLSLSSLLPLCLSMIVRYFRAQASELCLSRDIYNLHPDS